MIGVGGDEAGEKLTEDQPSPDRVDVPPSITDLLVDYQRRTGDSLPAVERRSARSGHAVSAKYLWQVSVGNVKGWPKNAETFSALAAGLETTELAIVLGYAVSLGVAVRTPQVAARLPLGIDDAPARLVEAFVTLGRAIAAPEAGNEDRDVDEDLPTVSDDDPGVDLLPPTERRVTGGKE